MSGLTNARKVMRKKRGKFPSHVAPQKPQLSVTDIVNVTHADRSSPAKRFAALQPWLDFANASSSLVRDVPFRRPQRERHTSAALSALWGFVERARETDSFPAGLLRQFLKPPSPETGLDADAGVKSVADLADNVIGILDYCVDKPLSPVPPPFYRVASECQTEVSIEAGRVARNTIGDPLEPFLRALEGTETDRIGRCPICDRFFFAIRTDRRACSRACGTVLRVREYRQRDDERISQTAEMLREGKEFREVARALGVDQDRARRYVRRAKSLPT